MLRFAAQHADFIGVSVHLPSAPDQALARDALPAMLASPLILACRFVPSTAGAAATLMLGALVLIDASLSYVIGEEVPDMATVVRTSQRCVVDAARREQRVVRSLRTVLTGCTATGRHAFDRPVAPVVGSRHSSS